MHRFPHRVERLFEVRDPFLVLDSILNVHLGLPLPRETKLGNIHRLLVGVMYVHKHVVESLGRYK